MKASLLVSILGASALVMTPAHGQGYIWLDNYVSSGPRITYADLGYHGGFRYADSSFTVGLYYALGDVRASIPFDWGAGFPGSPPLILGTGPGSTTPIFSYPGLEGYFSATAPFTVPGSTPGQTITVEVIVYNGADYANSLLRWHTPPFIMPELSAISVPPAAVGSYMPVPERSTIVLVVLAAVSHRVRQIKKYRRRGSPREA